MTANTLLCRNRASKHLRVVLRDTIVWVLPTVSNGERDIAFYSIERIFIDDWGVLLVFPFIVASHAGLITLVASVDPASITFETWYRCWFWWMRTWYSIFGLSSCCISERLRLTAHIRQSASENNYCLLWHYYSHIRLLFPEFPKVWIADLLIAVSCPESHLLAPYEHDNVRAIDDHR